MGLVKELFKEIELLYIVGIGELWRMAWRIMGELV